MKRTLVESVLPALLQSIARFCVKHSVSIRDLLNASKRAFLEAALEELDRRGERPSISRINLLTGLHRVEIPKLLEKPENQEMERPTLLARIVSTWESAAHYRKKNGRPRVLTCEGGESEFHQLSWAISKSLHPAAVLKELERLEIVSVKSGRATLLGSEAIPVEEIERSYHVMAKDFLDLYRTVDENIEQTGAPYDLHIRTEYDNIYQARLPEIRRWIGQEGRRFHARLRNYLARMDRDLSPQEGEAGGRVVVTSFSHSSELGIDTSRRKNP